MSPLTLIDELLHEQQSLTAVERFSQRHAHTSAPILERYYRDLIPLSKPGEGEQYGFEVDLDACSGCKACVSACNHLNGLDAEETWRDTGLLVGVYQGLATQQVVTTACHHCADPACANGCPTLAYEKDAETGIVRHLDDQCMGCRYCELKCPYQVPKYNARLGIVRKCDLCQSRLAVGEAPACVQACPNQAIRIRVVTRKSAASTRLLPGTVDSAYTQPTTNYVNLHEAANQLPGDADSFRPGHRHFPLVWMLVLVPMSVGISTTVWLGGATATKTLLLATMLGCLGLAGSVLHLGRPSQAWRAFLGWRRSWLSREIIAFNLWIGALGAFLGSAWTPWASEWVLLLGGLAALLGVIGLVASVNVYADTQRPFWNRPHTAMRFFGTAITAGFLFSPEPAFAAVSMAILLGLDARVMLERDPDDPVPGALMRGPLRMATCLRITASLVFMVSASVGNPWVSLSILAVSEFAARSLFFRAVNEPRMPGFA